MAKIKVNVPHDLEPTEAVVRLREFSDKVRDQLGEEISSIEETWVEERLEFKLKARGLSIQGNLAVSAQSVDVVTSLPFAALPFRGMLESYIREAIAKALE